MNKTQLTWMIFLLAGKIFCQTLPSNLALNRAAWASTQYDYVHTAHLATDGDTLNTYWKSAARKDSAELEWIFLDLGKVFEINKVILRWGKAYGEQYSVQVSKADRPPKVWSEVLMYHKGDGQVDRIDLPPTEARFVRILILDKTTIFDPIFLRSFEVYGEGERVQAPFNNHSGFDSNNRYLLNGNWLLQNTNQVNLTGQAITNESVDTTNWLRATVPGTVLTTYLDNGAIPDPNYADWQLQVSENFTQNAYWYRTEFNIPENFQADRIWLHFNGINYKADIFLNGQFVKTIERCFLRHQLDITSLIRLTEKNRLAVKIHPVKTPGRVSVQNYNNIGNNGGKLGADNPTFHFSVGWDWNPTVRGRNIGIWDEVFLSSSKQITLHDPYVITQLPLPDTTMASLQIKANVRNHDSAATKGTLIAKINDGEIFLKKSIEIAGNSTKEIAFSPKDFPQLQLANPELWWPNGYGKPQLYHLELSFVDSKNQISDILRKKFGIRTIDYEYNNNSGLQILVNGKKILCRGGNWGSNDINIRFDKARYERQIRYHQQMNFNMIRNWVGQTGHECFYDYCDQYGILVWDDFWLANSWDGPNPRETKLFMRNVKDKINRLRHHPSVAVWCGRNETKAPPKLEREMAKAVTELDGHRLFVKNSRAFPARQSSGPWNLVESPNWYFNMPKGFLTELGLPCVPPLESMQRFLPEMSLWPINDMWGLHDFGKGAAKAGTYTKAICDRYGDPESIDDYCMKSQMVNWNNYKALFEAWGQSVGEKESGGVLLWMSQSTWPSLVWQTYDYYFEQTGAYFGSKLACEPVHIQWDQTNNTAFVINTTQHKFEALEAEVRIYNLDGALAFQGQSEVGVEAYNKVRALEFPNATDASLSEVHFVKMYLRRNNELISENFYWRSKQGQDYRALGQLSMMELNVETLPVITAKKRQFTVRVKNKKEQVALSIRLKLMDPQTGLTVLPVSYSDNYFSLIPGEEKNIQIDLDANLDIPVDTYLEIEGWNILPGQRFRLPLGL